MLPLRGAVGYTEAVVPARLALLATLGLPFFACIRAEPPAPDVAPADLSVSPLVLPLPTHASPSSSAALPVAPVASASGSGPSPSVRPPDSDESAALPQTHDRPKSDGAVFDSRVQALWDAIVHDEPERALPFFFPAKAYAQVKAIPHPESDWRHRLVAAYGRDIHALHKRLGDAPASAKLVRFEVPAGGGRWVEPDEETNKIGYFRVYGSRLHFESGGAQRSFDVKSLISWRGEWFVVHLSGFK